MGDTWCNDPEDTVKAKYIIIRGADPVWCSMHTMKHIYQAREKGAKVAVIDPLLTQTAMKADLYLHVHPESDSALTLGMVRHLVDKGLVDQDSVNSCSHGYAEFEKYLRNGVTVEWASEVCGLLADAIRQLAEELTTVNPATMWISYDTQRRVSGGVNIRAIDVFMAITGNIGTEGGGAHYGRLYTWGFSYSAMLQKPPVDSAGIPGAAGTASELGSVGEVAQYSNRLLNIDQTVKEILEANGPSIRMLWVVCKNPFAQDLDRSKVEKAFEKSEMVVCADQFFNETVQHTDIVLPITTAFEEWNVDVSCQHYWFSINQPAIKPVYEAKCDLEIAVLLSRTVNKLEPGSCIFLQEFDHKRWLDQEFSDGMTKMFGISSWDGLLEGLKEAILPSSAAWYDRKFKAPSRKFEFKSEPCERNGHTTLPEYKPETKSALPLHLFTPHVQFDIHSQFINLDWIQVLYPEPFVYMHSIFTGKRGIAESDLVKVFNTVGEVELRAKATANAPGDFLVTYEAWLPKRKYNTQNAAADTPADAGLVKTGAPGTAIHSQFANIILIDKGTMA